MRWARHVARKGERRDVYRVIVGEPEGKKPLGRPRHRWKDNIKLDLQEVGCGVEMELRSISTLSPVGSNIGALYQNCTYSQKVFLRMGEFVARNM